MMLTDEQLLILVRHFRALYPSVEEMDALVLARAVAREQWERGAGQRGYNEKIALLNRMKQDIEYVIGELQK